MENSLQALGIPPTDFNVVLQVSGNEALKRAVAAGAGIGFISRRAVVKEIASGELAVVKIEGLSITRNFYVLHHKNHGLPLAEVLWKFLIDRADTELISTAKN